jgi:hypothetical protein
MLVTKLAPDVSEPPMLILHPWYWGKPNYIFQSLSIDNSSLISKSIQQTFTQSPSLGTRCMKSTMLDKKFYPCQQNNYGHISVPTNSDVMNALNKVNYNQTRISPECDCWQKMQTCPIGSGGPGISYDITETQDNLYDLQGFNITDWLVKTEYNDEYSMKRFGGMEFFLRYTTNSLDLVNETLISQIANLSSSMIDASKIASFFRIQPPQVSVIISFSYSSKVFEILF